MKPGEQCPDLTTLNDSAPRSEWGLDFNKNPKGPYQLQSVLYLFDPQTMQKYTYPTSTTGGNICLGELKDATQMMRKFRGPSLIPVVALTNKHMATRFGGRLRPYFQICGGSPSTRAEVQRCHPAPHFRTAIAGACGTSAA